MKFLALSMVAGAAIFAAGVASAATVAFNNNNHGVVGNFLPTTGVTTLSFVGDDGTGVDAMATRMDNNNNPIGGTALIAKYNGSSGGLGVCTSGPSRFGDGCKNSDNHQVDGGNSKSDPDEMVKFTFDEAVRLLSVTFSLVGNNDDFNFRFFDGNQSFDDIALGNNGSIQTYTFNGVYEGTMFGIGADGSSDEFKIRSLTYELVPTQVVPLPASAFLMMAGFFGLAALRRRAA